MVSEGDFAGRRINVAAEQAGIARSVVRRAERALRDERLTGFQQTDYAMDFRCFQRLVKRERRQNGSEPFRKHRFASAWRADEQQCI